MWFWAVLWACLCWAWKLGEQCYGSVFRQGVLFFWRIHVQWLVARKTTLCHASAGLCYARLCYAILGCNMLCHAKVCYARLGCVSLPSLLVSLALLLGAILEPYRGRLEPSWGVSYPSGASQGLPSSGHTWDLTGPIAEHGICSTITLALAWSPRPVGIL